MNNILIFGILFNLSMNSYGAINKEVHYQESIDRVLVAVIDTGADITHKDLKKFIWLNEGESGKDSYGRDKSTNGVDDDMNGYIDDLHGWNFANNSNDLSDFDGHGTHITGIIKDQFQKQKRNPKQKDSLQMMILKYYDPKAEDTENIANTIKAIHYATQMKARLINYSGGGAQKNLMEYQAILQAGQKEILFIAAAGNNKTDTDDTKFYPASYKLKNIISVAAVDNNGELMPFSNYGRNSIDVAAPGKSIYSTLPHNTHGFMSGTSQATAFITGMLARLILKNNLRKSQEMLVDLLATGIFNKSLKNKTKFQLALMQ